MSEQDELSQEIRDIISKYHNQVAFVDEVPEILAKVKQRYEQKEVDSEALIRKLLKEVERLSQQCVTSPIDIIAKARAELADLESRRLK